MASSFESQQEFEARQADALDYLRTETARHLRKYARRIKTEGERRVKAQFALDPNVDPEGVAREALAVASQGMFIEGPRELVDGATSASD